MNLSRPREDGFSIRNQSARFMERAHYRLSSQWSDDESLVCEVTAAPEPEQPKESITYKRRKPSGKHEADLAKLPVETVVYSLPEGEQICDCCGGTLHEMSTETRREIAVVPAQVKVVEHVRQVYACRHCERHELQTPIVTAPMPLFVYPGSLASPSAMAHEMC